MPEDKKVNIEFTEEQSTEETQVEQSSNPESEITESEIKDNIESTPETKDELTEKQDVSQETLQPGEYDVDEIFRFLADNGVINPRDNQPELKSIEDVAKYVYDNNQTLVQQEVQKELENYPQSYKDLFEYVKNGGKVDDFVNSYKDSYSTLDPIMLKGNTDLQRKVMKDYYKSTTQWSDSMIDTQLSKFDDDEIAKLSKTTLNELKNIESQRQTELRQSQEQQIKQQQEVIQQTIQHYKEQLNTMKSVGDLPLTINDKKVIEDNLFNNKTYNKLTTDFEKYRMNLAILDSYGLLEDVNKITELLKSKTTNNKYNFKKSTKKSDSNIDFDINIVNPKDSGNQDDRVGFIF